MQTTAFASRSSQILKTSADVVNPKTVKLKLKGLEMAFNPPILHKEELHLALTGKNTMNCLKYVDFYGPDSDTPIASMAYEGNLHLLSDQERRELASPGPQQGAGTAKTNRRQPPLRTLSGGRIAGYRREVEFLNGRRWRPAARPHRFRN